MLLKLLQIRLSFVYPVLFLGFFIALSFLDRHKLTPGQLALFSVNSFLFGYYFGPILGAQKMRVDTIAATIRAEQMALLDILAHAHMLPARERHNLKVRLRAYLESITGNRRLTADNPYYDELLRFIKGEKFKGNGTADMIYGRLSKTQENRSTLNSLFRAAPFSHEWLVLAVLFFVTLFFVMQTDYGASLFFRVLLAILCTGLTLLIVILAKFSTLTHKQARRMWEPLQDLLQNHFEDVGDKEVMALRGKLEGKPKG